MRRYLCGSALVDRSVVQGGQCPWQAVRPLCQFHRDLCDQKF